MSLFAWLAGSNLTFHSLSPGTLEILGPFLDGYVSLPVASLVGHEGRIDVDSQGTILAWPSTQLETVDDFTPYMNAWLARYDIAPPKGGWEVSLGLCH